MVVVVVVLITTTTATILRLLYRTTCIMPSVLWRCKKTEWWGVGAVICLQRDAHLHMAQLMPLPLTVSCFSKIQTGFTFLVLAHPGSHGKGPLNGCVCVCVCVYRTTCISRQPRLKTGWFYWSKVLLHICLCQQKLALCGLGRKR